MHPSLSSFRIFNHDIPKETNSAFCVDMCKMADCDLMYSQHESGGTWKNLTLSERYKIGTRPVKKIFFYLLLFSKLSAWVGTLFNGGVDSSNTGRFQVSIYLALLSIMVSHDAWWNNFAQRMRTCKIDSKASFEAWYCITIFKSLICKVHHSIMLSSKWVPCGWTSSLDGYSPGKTPSVVCMFPHTYLSRGFSHDPK